MLDGQPPSSNITLFINRIAMTIKSGERAITRRYFRRRNQLFMNDVFLKRLFAVSITSSGNSPAFSLTLTGD
ncbi:hypothetical protein [Escherichia coli]|uniref:hypothetical protein n=1 Tax=Escherichia coli TaxID=562 RepID=UPI003CC91DDC